MLCESCKEKEATIHLTQVVDGEIKKLHLCEACAAKKGIDFQGPLSITDILLGMGIQKPSETASAERTCPRCHMRRTDFKKTGRFGCAACYDAFAEELPPLLKAMHRSDHHTGKVPSRESRRVQATAELASLQQQMDKAIAAENFEEAARLRDAILACRRRLSEPEARNPS
jgi:protein arginine kinase activator